MQPPRQGRRKTDEHSIPAPLPGRMIFFYDNPVVFASLDHRLISTSPPGCHSTARDQRLALAGLRCLSKNATVSVAMSIVFTECSVKVCPVSGMSTV